MNKMKSFSNKGLRRVSITTCYYSTVWIRKNNSIQAILDMNYCLGAPWNSLGLRVCSMEISMGQNIVGGGSSVWYDASFITRWKLRESTDLNLRYLPPTASIFYQQSISISPHFNFKLDCLGRQELPITIYIKNIFRKGKMLSMFWRSGGIIIY